MRSASVQALASLRREAEKVEAGLGPARELFAVARVLGDSVQLRAAVVGGSAAPEQRAALAEATFGTKISADALGLVRVLASQRWSLETDAIAALEEVAIRMLARSGADARTLDDELLDIAAVVSSDADLELSLGSKLATPEAKGELVERIFGTKASEAAVAIARQLVLQPRGRSVLKALRQAARLVADEAGFDLALVTSAEALAEGRRDSLADILSARYGRPLRIRSVIDPSVLGGLRIQVGAEVIDGTVATRLHDARLRIA